MRTINQPSQQISIATTTTTINNTAALQRPPQPKIPPTAFQLYCNDFISSSTQLQTFNTHNVTHQLKVQWNSMSDVVKQPYIDYGKILQKQYEEALKHYELYNMQNQVNNNIWGSGSRTKSAPVPQHMQNQRIQVFGSNIKQSTFTLYDATLQQKLQNAKGRGLGLSLLSLNSINKTTQSIISPPNNNGMVDLTVDTENKQQISSTKSKIVHQKVQGKEEKDQRDYKNRGGNKKDYDAKQQSSTNQVQQQQAPKVKNNLSQKVQNDSINTPVKLKRKRDDEPNNNTSVHPEKDFQKWLSTRKDEWVHKRQMKQKNRIQTKADRDMANSKARDKTDEVSFTKKQPLRSKYVIGYPVWFNIHYSKSCSNRLIADSGIVKSVSFNRKTQQLELEVVSNVDSSVLTLTSEDLAFAVHCPVLIKMDEQHLNGEIINIKPTESTVNKATFTYTVMTNIEGRCLIEEGVTDDRICYKLSLPLLQSKIKDIVPSLKSKTKFGIRTSSDGRPTLNKAPLVLQFQDRSQKVPTNIDKTSNDQNESYSSNDEEEQERESRSSTDYDSVDEHEKKRASSSLPKIKKRKKLEKTKDAAVGHDTRDSVKEVDKGKCNSSNRRSRSAMVGSTCKEDPLSYVGNYIANRLVADEGWQDKVEKIDLINFGQVVYKPEYTKKTAKKGKTKFTGYAALARYACKSGIYKEKVVDTIHGQEILAKLGIIDDPYSIFSDIHPPPQNNQQEDDIDAQREGGTRSPEVQDDDSDADFDLDKYLATGIG